MSAAAEARVPAAAGWWHGTPARIVKVAVLLALLLLVPAWSENPYITTIFISAVMFGLLGAIYDLMIGFAGLTNFGYAGFIAVGAYASALATFHHDVSPWLGLALGGLAGALLGLFTGLVTLRLRGLYLGLTTWFLAEAIRLTISNATDYTRGVMGLNVAPFPDLFGISFARGQLLPYYYLLLAIAAAILITTALVLRSRIGLAFKAMREDELATQSLGLDTVRLKLLNFTLASAFTGIVGAFYCRYLGILTPTPEEFGVPRTVEILTIAYVGGRGTLWGSLFAAFLLIGLQEYFRSLEAWRLVIYGGLLIVVILFLPKGLAGLRRYLW